MAKAKKAKKTARKPAKKPVKQPAKKKPVSKAKKVAAKKPAPKKAASVAKKSAPKKSVATKVAARKPVRTPARKPVSAKSAAKPVAKPAAKPSGFQPPRPLMPIRPAPVLRGAAAVTKKLTAKDLEQFRVALLHLRDRYIDKISFLSQDNLSRSSGEAVGDMTANKDQADQGTDNYDREFAANQLTNEQDALYEIDEALRRIEAKTFGICEATGKPIEYERLKALPYTRYCLAAQAELERGRPRFRPVRRTSIQMPDSQNSD